MRVQGVNVGQSIEFHGGCTVISSRGELEENKLLPVALTTSIACDFLECLHFFRNIAE